MAFCVRLGAFVSGWASLGVSPPGFLRACRRPRLEALSGVPLFREVHTVSDLCTSAANLVFPGLRLLLLVVDGLAIGSILLLWQPWRPGVQLTTVGPVSWTGSDTGLERLRSIGGDLS